MKMVLYHDSEFVIEREFRELQGALCRIRIKPHYGQQSRHNGFEDIIG